MSESAQAYIVALSVLASLSDFAATVHRLARGSSPVAGLVGCALEGRAVARCSGREGVELLIGNVPGGVL